jgi:hypothetical protein
LNGLLDSHKVVRINKSARSKTQSNDGVCAVSADSELVVGKNGERSDYTFATSGKSNYKNQLMWESVLDKNFVARGKAGRSGRIQPELSV